VFSRTRPRLRAGPHRQHPLRVCLSKCLCCIVPRMTVGCLFSFLRAPTRNRRAGRRLAVELRRGQHAARRRHLSISQHR
jgi:hypothetical protein